jgi:hypothetical protein
MQQYISVGMTREPAVMGNQDAADFQRDARLELVRVPAEADAGCAGDMGVTQWKQPRGLKPNTYLLSRRG